MRNPTHQPSALPARALACCLLALTLLAVGAGSTPALAAEAQARFTPTTHTDTAAIVETAIAKAAPPSATDASKAEASPFILDRRQILSPDTRDRLERTAAQLARTHGVGVYLLTVGGIGSKTVRDFAIDQYHSLNLGVGAERSGILFLIAADSRDYVTITYGKGITAFTDYQLERIENEVVNHLRSDSWNDAAEAYVSQCARTLEFYAEKGEPLDRGNAPIEPVDVMAMAAMALAAGAVVAGLAIAGMARSMRSARTGQEARAYLDSDSFSLTHSDDQFVTTTLAVIPHPKSDSSSSGGGSSIGSGGFGGTTGGKF
ncbi:TPM domain-containing protein [Eggerthellaceae bacterium zg-997]|nr:TPM domain-containing protein [Eggerthellaceae bacterium zg-997]